MRLIVSVGARPNVIKVGPLIPELKRAGIQVDVVFTGARSLSHPEQAGDAVSFYGVEMPAPRWFLDVGEGTDAATTGRAMVAFEELFAGESADGVIAVGDVNPTLAVAISAAKAGIPVIHLDAGLRCGDLRQPAEVNRVLISRIAAVHLTPSERALENLEDEGIEPERIHFVGNLMAESVLRYTDEIKGLRACSEYGLPEKGYVLASFHQCDNLDDRSRMEALLAGLAQSPLPVLLPDPRGFAGAVAGFGLTVPASVRIVGAVPYRSMLSLERDCAAVITDSGGVQVEACMLNVSCVTVRDCTEVVSTVSLGANRLVDADPSAIRAALVEAVSRPGVWTAPKRWDRAVSDRIARVLKRGITPLS